MDSLKLTKDEWQQLNGEYVRNQYFGYCQSLDLDEERADSLKYIELTTLHHIRERLAAGDDAEEVRRGLNMPSAIYRHMRNLIGA